MLLFVHFISFHKNISFQLYWFLIIKLLIKSKLTIFPCVRKKAKRNFKSNNNCQGKISIRYKKKTKTNKLIAKILDKFNDLK